MRVDSNMRLACLLLLTATASGCVWTSDGGFAPREESGFYPAVESGPGSFAGEPIVFNTYGRVTIVGVEGRDSISVRPRFYAGARDDADASTLCEQWELGENL